MYIADWLQRVAAQNKLYAINRCNSCVGDCNDKLHTVQYPATKTCETTSNPMIQLEDMNICYGSSKELITFDIIAANVGSTKNEKSIVLKVTAGSQSVLLTVDICRAPAGALQISPPWS